MTRPETEPDRDCRQRDECARCPLSRIGAGMVVRVKQLCAPPGVAQRLREIGLGEEQIIKLIAGSSNIICQMCDARLAISAQLAESILVEPLARPFSAGRAV